MMWAGSGWGSRRSRCGVSTVGIGMRWRRGAELPAVGETVRGEIDWARRYALMRTHTAMHILCGVIWRDYGASVTGGNMQPLDARMDFEFARMQKELVVEIEAKINAEVAAERAVRGAHFATGGRPSPSRT